MWARAGQTTDEKKRLSTGRLIGVGLAAVDKHTGKMAPPDEQTDSYVDS